MDILIPYLHYLGIMVLTGSLMAAYMLVTSGITRKNIGYISGMNVLYWISILVVLITGFLRWFVVGKHAIYYNSNPWFHTKLTLFFILMILAISASLKIRKWKVIINMGRLEDITSRQTKAYLNQLRVQFILIALLPLLASVVAHLH